MDTLKKIEGAGRLGVHVRNAISRSLESYGLGHLPQELPSTQEDPVRLYLLGSPVADVIKAVFDSERQEGTTHCVRSVPPRLRNSCTRSGRSSAADHRTRPHS